MSTVWAVQFEDDNCGRLPVIALFRHYSEAKQYISDNNEEERWVIVPYNNSGETV